MRSSTAGRTCRVPRAAAAVALWCMAGASALAAIGCASGGGSGGTSGSAAAAATALLAASSMHQAPIQATATDPSPARAAEPAGEPASEPAAGDQASQSDGYWLAPVSAERAGGIGRSALVPAMYADVVPGEAPPPSPFTVSAQATYMYGSVGGYVQAPLGGKAGTSSANRPRLEGIGINASNIADGELAIGWDSNQQVFFGGQYIHLGGTNTLTSSLVSRGVTFPKGTVVKSELRLDWYRFGYRYAFVLSRATNGVPDLTLTPWIEGLAWNFGYTLNGSKVGTAGRAFVKPGVQLGGTLAWRPFGGPLSLEAAAGSFPQTHSFTQISVESLLARYRFMEFHKYEFNFLLGVIWEQQDFHDAQTLANHLSADFGPMVQAGLQVNF